MEDHDRELTISIREDGFGNALYSFIQAILRISDVTYLRRELVRSTFLEDFKQTLTEIVYPDRLSFDWNDPERDPEGKYTVDCCINGMRKPLFVFALSNDDRTRDATITMLFYGQRGLSHRSLGIFEDQELINRKVLARFSDVCEKQFSTLRGNRDRIKTFVEDMLPD